MATPTHMPARGHSTAPKFDPNQPRSLKRYFNELDILLVAAGLTGDEERKTQAVRYLDVDTAELWELLPEFGINSTYAEFQEAIYKLYPTSKEERRWAVADMDKLVGEQGRLGIHNEAELGSYFRSFFAVTSYLISKDRISK